MNGSEQRKITELEALVRKGRRVVEDFLPNIGQCALQNYGELNEFMVESQPYVEKVDEPSETKD